MDTTLPASVTTYRLVLEKAMFPLAVAYLCMLPVSMAGMELFSALLAVTVFLHWRMTGGAGRPPAFIPLLVFCAVIVAGILLGEASLREKVYDLGRLRFFLFYAMWCYLFAKGLLPRNFWLKPLAGVTLIVGIYGFFQHFIPMDLVRPADRKMILYALPDLKQGPLVLGTFNQHLTFASIFLSFACLATSLGLASTGWVRRLGMGLGGLLFLDCFWTQSRTAWIAIPICLFVLLLGHRVKHLGRWVTGVVLVMVFTLLATPSSRERIARTLFKSADHNFVGYRVKLWKINLEMFREAPWLGVGWNNSERQAPRVSEKLFPQEREPIMGHAHSNLIQILTTTGILGLLAYLALWWAFFKILLQRLPHATGFQRGLTVGLLAAFVGFHLQGLSQWNFGDAEVIHSLMFLWGLTATLVNSDRKATVDAVELG